ncbi:MAG: hypothetical protein IJW50_10740 [Clostridia bacterium]|nr:hypothetical protein [Clostridia bacterium]
MNIFTVSLFGHREIDDLWSYQAMKYAEKRNKKKINLYGTAQNGGTSL